MKSLAVAFTFLTMTLIPMGALAVTATIDKDIKNESVERDINADLSARYQNGKLVTSQGIIQLTPAVIVDDKRPVSDWYKNPADAKVSLKYRGDRLDRVVIFK